MDSDRAFWNRDGVRHAIDKVAAAKHLLVIAGAGISIEAGLPSWYSLVGSLLRGLVDDDDQAALFEQEVLRTEGLMGAGDVAIRMHPNFVEELRKALYPDNASGVAGPSALAIASAKESWGADCTVATLNYDDLLERALHDTFGRKPETWVQAVQQGNRLGVFHLHGFLPPEGPPKGKIILGMSDYVTMKDGQFPEDLIQRVAKTPGAVILIVGSSLGDYNLLKSIYRHTPKGKSSNKVVAVMSPLAAGNDRRDTYLKHYFSAIDEKWRRAKVDVVYLDHFFQTAQFISEAVFKREDKKQYVPYRDRCEKLEELQNDPENFASLRPKNIEDAQAYIQMGLDDILQEVNKTVPLESGEIRAVHLFRRWFEKKSLVQIGSSDRIWQTSDAYQPIPFVRDSDNLAVVALSEGVVKKRLVTPESPRWDYQTAIPIFTSLTDKPYQRIPLGTVLITSNLAGESTKLGRRINRISEAKWESLTSYIVQQAAELLASAEE